MVAKKQKRPMENISLVEEDYIIFFMEGLPNIQVKCSGVKDLLQRPFWFRYIMRERAEWMR